MGIALAYFHRAINHFQFVVHWTRHHHCFKEKLRHCVIVFILIGLLWKIYRTSKICLYNCFILKYFSASSDLPHFTTAHLRTTRVTQVSKLLLYRYFPMSVIQLPEVKVKSLRHVALSMRHLDTFVCNPLRVMQITRRVLQRRRFCMCLPAQWCPSRSDIGFMFYVNDISYVA
jgi:hypothetical protein